MHDTVFLYKIKDSDDRDVCAYTDVNPMRFECGHYFGSPSICGAAYSGRQKMPSYSEIETVLSKDEYARFIEFDNAINALGYGIEKGDERYKQGVQLCNKIRPVFDKLNSADNADLFARIVEEEKEWVMEEYNLDDEEVDEVFENYPFSSKYQDRAIVSCIFNDIDDAAYEEARSLGYADKNNDRWFDYKLFGQDLLEEEGYYEISDGRVVYYNM